MYLKKVLKIDQEQDMMSVGEETFLYTSQVGAGALMGM